jgi:non-specific serine/threonine protein kinase/serine/threonine-protein kinase
VTPAQFERMRDLLGEALALPRERRDAFVASACAGDPALGAELRALVAAHEDAARDGFLEAPAFAPSGATAPPAAGAAPPPGRRIGAYEVLGELGRGGMGVVVKAARADDAYRKAVAIKLVPEAGLSSRARQRFLDERQILAGLEHPNIARLLDGGTTAEGVPYLVMELVEGEPIDAYCDRRRLGVVERLRLFLPVAAAVHHAHRSLVVHRDLKPANVLVGADGAPKLLDFGIARPVEPGEVGATLTQARALTPSYASPEQLRGGPIGTATDVYSLGVMLYELLTGRRPHRGGEGSASAEVVAASARREPEPPSAAVDRAGADAVAIAAARGTTPRALRARLRGDLDTILLTALRDDPARRHGSAEAFADDVRRHLEGLPVRARPPTARYRAGKFVRRNAALVGAVGSALLLLLGGVLATSWQARRAEAQRRVAERRFEDVRRLAHALLFDVHDAVAPLAGSTAARELLVRDGLAYLDGLAREASGDRSLEVELALAYLRVGDLQGGTFMANLGDVAGAARSYRKARALLERGGPRGPEERAAHARVLCALSSLEASSGDAAAARADAEAALSIARAALPAAAPGERREAAVALSRALFAVAFAAFHRGDAAAAEAAALEEVTVLEELRARHAGDAEIAALLAGAQWLLAGTRWSAGALPEAAERYERALELQEALLRERPERGRTLRQLAFTAEALGVLSGQLGRPERGVALLRRAVEARRSLAEGDPHDADARLGLLAARKNLAVALVHASRPADAVRELEAVWPELDRELAAAPRSVPLRRLLAEAHGAWSLVHAARAGAERGPARARELAARRERLASALAAWRALEADGGLGAQDRGTYLDVRRALEASERELAALAPRASR